MASTPTPGERVFTTRFGPGMIMKLTRTGALIALDRMPKMPLELPLSQLTSESGQAYATDSLRTAAEGERRPKGTTAADAAQHNARTSVEALRFGIVPEASIREVTVGFDGLSRWVTAHLPHRRNGLSHVSQVCGSFGSGKSHTMAAIRLIAREEGYVTAHVEVNGNDVSLSDPEGVLRQLWPTSTAAEFESPHPMVDLNLRAIEKGRAQSDHALAAFDRVQSNLKTIATLHTLNCLDKNAEDVEGFLQCGNTHTASQLFSQLSADVVRHGGSSSFNSVPVKRLIGQKVDDRPSDFVNCLLGYAVLARRAGFQGLVITIDEFEVEYTLSEAKFERIQDLATAMRDELGGEKVPLTVFVATVGQEGHAGDEVVGSIVDATGGDEYSLQPWTRDSMRELSGKIHELYCRAYDIDKTTCDTMARQVEAALDDDDVESSGLVRAFIKHFVGALDAAHGPGPQ